MHVYIASANTNTSFITPTYPVDDTTIISLASIEQLGRELPVSFQKGYIPYTWRWYQHSIRQSHTLPIETYIWNRLCTAIPVVQWDDISLDETKTRPNDIETPIQTAFTRLDELAELGPNWDSYGADPVTQRAISAARQLLVDIVDRLGTTALETALPYNIAPLNDGGIQLEWISSRCRYEVEISPDGIFTFATIRRVNNKPKSEVKHNISRAKTLQLVTESLTS
jgi:hypothetical protein